MGELLTVHLPVAEQAVLWPPLVLLGILLGLVSATMGVGAGIISVPILFAVYGLPYEVAVGTSLAVIIGNAALGATGHARRGNVDLRLGLPLGVGIAGGTLGGGWVLHLLASLPRITVLGHERRVTQVVGAVLFALLLSYIGILTLRRVRRTVAGLRQGLPDEQEQTRPPPGWLRTLRLPPLLDLRHQGLEEVSVWPLVGVGLVAGLAAGMMGVGGGFLMVPVLLYWFRVRTLVAVGTSLAGILVAALCGTTQKLYLGEVDLLLAGLLLAGGALGIILGVRLTGRLAPHRLRFAYGVFCLCGALLALAKLTL